MTGWTFAGILILTAAVYLLASGFVTTWMRFRGKRVITCPENELPAAVRVNALNAAKWTAISGDTDLHLRSCSRWPEKADCGQECLSQIVSSPEACLLSTIVTLWYDGKHCAVCRRPIGKIAWHERPAALRAPDGSTREWKEFRPEDLPLVFRTHEALCWPCHVHETFRREHPTWVVERPRRVEPAATLPPSAAVY